MRNHMKIETTCSTQGLLPKAFAIVMVIGLLSSSAFSQTRIRFARGASSATVTGNLSPGYVRSYVVGARAGQMLTVRVRSAGNVWLDIGGNDVGEQITIELNSTDDYIITVHNDDDHAARYSLYVAIN